MDEWKPGRVTAAVAELKAAIAEAGGADAQNLLIAVALKDGRVIADYTGCTCPACTLRIMLQAGCEVSTKAKRGGPVALVDAADAARSVH